MSTGVVAATRAVPDVCSAANLHDYVTEHLSFSGVLDFASHTLRAECVLVLRRIDLAGSPCADPARLSLDVHKTLHVSAVYAARLPEASSEAAEAEAEAEAEAAFTVDAEFARYGAALHVTLPAGAVAHAVGGRVRLRVVYEAGAGPAFCWLQPSQTAGKRHPYLFTQGQACLNRSFFPCQDSPAVKAPYRARLTVPKPLMAVMSASESTLVSEDDATRTYEFVMSTPVPAYLIALAVGEMERRAIGPRSSVYAEPPMIEAAVKEFADVTESFVAKGESLFGPYRWGRYDLLVMPPSFPFGGMENPCLTFVTPAVVAGDRSLIDVVVHEIAHSWFGNLVTNMNWGEFWLNEGFTMYAQRRITTELFGAAFTCAEASTGRALLRDTVAELGDDHPLTRLRVHLEKGVDPDETYNETPYEKGYAFVSYLCSLVGSVQAFDAFLTHYTTKFAFRSIQSEDLFQCFFEYFPHLAGADKRPGLEFQEVWLNKGGMPVYLPDLSAGDALTQPAEQLAAALVGGSVPSELAAAAQSWNSSQLCHLLNTLRENAATTADTVRALVKLLPHVASRSSNAEIRQRYCMLVLKNNMRDEFEAVRGFLHDFGKQKYTLPMYKLAKGGSAEALEFAHKVFAETRDSLHQNVRHYVETILGISA